MANLGYYFYSWAPGVKVVATFGLLLLLLGPRSRSSGQSGLLLLHLGEATFRVKTSNVSPFEFPGVWQDTDVRSDARALQEPVAFRGFRQTLFSFAVSRVRAFSVLFVFPTVGTHRELEKGMARIYQ